MTQSRFWTIPAAAILLAGCALERATTATQARDALVGKSKSEILACAGAPDRERREGDWEYLSYLRVEHPSGGELPGEARRENPALAKAFADRRYCEVTFVLHDGRVQRLGYAGNTGGLLTQGEQCGYIVEPCVEPRAR